MATDRERAEDALQDYVERFDLLAQGANIGFWDARAAPGCELLSPHTEVYYSPTFKQLLGYDDEDFPPRVESWESRLHPDDHDRVMAALREHLEGRAPYDVEYRLKTKGGEIRWFSASGQARWDENGNATRTVGSLRNITPRKQAEQALRETGAQLHRVLDAAPIILAAMDRHGVFTLLGGKGLTSVGLEPQHMIGKSIFDIFAGHDDILQAARRMLGGNDSLAILSCQGRTFECRPFVIRDAAGEIDDVSNVAVDITDRKVVEHERSRRITQLWRLAGAYLSITAAQSVEAKLGEITDQAREVIGAHQSSCQLILEGNAAGANCAVSLSEKHAGGRDADADFDAAEVSTVVCRTNHPVRLARRDFKSNSCEEKDCPSRVDGCLAVPLINPDGQNIGVLSLSDKYEGDFTADDEAILSQLALVSSVAIENARLFEAARTARERSQMLSRRLVEVQEEERRHIARELHDDIGQIVTGLRLTLDGGIRSSGEVSVARIRRALTLTDELLERVRNLSLQLRPPMLDNLGLIPALLWHFDCYTAQTGVRVVFDHSGCKDRRFRPDIETNVYRIIQEALTNVARHAGAQEAIVRLWADSNLLGFDIEDRGGGFDVAILPAAKVNGLTGMRERAASLGGDLRIDSHPGEGSCIRAELPLGSVE